MIGKADVRLGEISEEARNQVGSVFAGKTDSLAAEPDGLEVLTTATPDASQIAHHHGIDLWTNKRFVDRQRVLVGTDRAVVVTHRLVDRGNCVQDTTFVQVVAGGPVRLQGAQAVVERTHVVARLVVHDSDEMQRPGEREGRFVGFCKFHRFSCQRKRVISLTGLMSDRCELVQSFSLVRAHIFGTGKHSSVESKLMRQFRLGRPATRRIIEQRAGLLLRRGLLGDQRFWHFVPSSAIRP